MSYTIKCDDGDLVASTVGRFIVITGQEKCAQDIAEALLNVWDPDGNNRFNGSSLALITGSDDLGMVEETIRYDVQSSIERLMDSQSEDTYVDDEEQIERIAQIHVRKMGLFTYGFYLKCITMSGDEVSAPFTISLGQQLPASLDLYALKDQMFSDVNDNSIL